MGKSDTKIPLERVDIYRWRIPKHYNPDMHVPGMVYADDGLIEQILQDNALQQVANVATLPGIVGHSLAMPDIHWGYGFPEDLEVTEEHGCLAGADPDMVSNPALQRGMKQLGSLGSGNHFCEVQTIDHIYDAEAAQAMGIGQRGQIVVTIHCGSRGFGHQVAEDYVRLAESKQQDFGFHLVDRQLACLPLQSNAGKSYLSAMACGANFAWANRQLLMHGVRQAFSSVFGRRARPKDMPLVYDVCHNIAKMEEYEVDGQVQRLCVHQP